MVVLTAAGSQYDTGGLLWSMVDGACQGHQVSDEYIFVQGTPGNVTVALIAVGLDSTGKPTIAAAKKVVAIGSAPVPPSPVPPNPPGPNPVPPGPQPPDDRYHLAPIALNAGNALPAAAKALCPALGDNFAASAASGATTVIGLNTDVFTRNQKTMGDIKPQFISLSDAIQNAMQPLNLTDVPSGKQAFLEIAYGLHQVK